MMSLPNGVKLSSGTESNPVTVVSEDDVKKRSTNGIGDVVETGMASKTVPRTVSPISDIKIA